MHDWMVLVCDLCWLELVTVSESMLNRSLGNLHALI